MAKSLRCRVGLHRWQKKWDHDKGMQIKECQVCGRRLGTGYPPGMGYSP